MYKSFFNLARNPFELTPDPAFLFPTKQHDEALANLLLWRSAAHRLYRRRLSRLEVVRPLESERDEGIDEPDVQLAANTLQDVYASLQKPFPPDTDLHFPLIGQVRQL
jgi:hypothetical protein